jgi:hypothetical protein
MASQLSDAAVQAIKDSTKTEILPMEDLDYVTRPVFIPPAEPAMDTLEFHTLNGLLAYVKANPDGLEDYSLHIVDETSVEYIGPIFGRHAQRMIAARATAQAILGDECFRFGTYYEVEEFVIKLSTLFVQEDELGQVIKLVGNIKEEKVRNTEDDGISQRVLARAGVASVAEVRVPNPVILRPYRTFREVEQPPSPFLLRLRGGREGGLPSCALFEADGGGWKLEAIQDIESYLNVRQFEGGQRPVFA